MKTINIKGKEYVTVNERLKEFRNNFKDYSLVTEIVELGTDFATVKAAIIDNNGVTRATGLAREVVAKSPINKYAFSKTAKPPQWDALWEILVSASTMQSAPQRNYW